MCVVRLFRPLAYTKTFALLASVLVALSVVPPLIYHFHRRRPRLTGSVVLRRGCTGLAAALALLGAPLLKPALDPPAEAAPCPVPAACPAPAPCHCACASPE